MKRLITLLVLLLLFCSLNTLYAQLTVKTEVNTNATQLANELIGNGVTISNANLVFGPKSAGIYTEGGVNGLSLDKDRGIILSTGDITGSDYSSHQGSFNNEQFALLKQYVNSQTNDVTYLEFDLIPQGNALTFNYVFASYEYHDFVNSNFNDVFGLFISGPGISGTKNIAFVPSTSEYVGINTINNGANNDGTCKNCDYFITNSKNEIGFHARTTPLEAKAYVTPQEQYHIILAIADVHDKSHTSAVFIEGNSFNSPPIVIQEPTLTIVPVETCFGENTLNEVQLSDLCGDNIYTEHCSITTEGVDIVSIGADSEGDDIVYNIPKPAFISDKNQERYIEIISDKLRGVPDTFRYVISVKKCPLVITNTVEDCFGIGGTGIDFYQNFGTTLSCGVTSKNIDIITFTQNGNPSGFSGYLKYFIAPSENPNLERSLSFYCGIDTIKVFVTPKVCTDETSCPIFSLKPGERYHLSYWSKNVSDANGVGDGTLYLEFQDPTGSSTTKLSLPRGITDTWIRKDTIFTAPSVPTSMNIRMVNIGNAPAYFDDIRIIPERSSAISYVYDPVTRRLIAELDENNFATFYEYDAEGNRERIKKETTRGIETIQEGRLEQIKVR